MTCLPRRVAHDEVVDDEEDQQDRRGEEERERGREAREHQAGRVEGEVEPERDQDAEDAAEGAALAEVEPARVDLDDRHGAEALEVHVHGVEHRERDAQVRERAREERQAHRDVRHDDASRADQHRATAAELVREGAVQEERAPVDEGADGLDRAEVLLGHQVEVVERALRRGQVVAPHVEERVGQPEREPVVEAAAEELGRVPHLDAREPGVDEGDRDEQPDDRERFFSERGKVHARAESAMRYARLSLDGV